MAVNQSGFKPGDSSINQVIGTTHEVYHSFNEGYEVRVVCLDFSKAFDKVWHDLSLSAKLLADDTSLFSEVFNVDASAKELNYDLSEV